MHERPGSELHAILEPEPAEYLRHVICDRPDGDDELLSDLTIGATVSDEPRDVPLTRCKRRGRSASARGRHGWQVGGLVRARRVTARLAAQLASHCPQLARPVGEPFGALAELDGLALENVGLSFQIGGPTIDGPRACVRQSYWPVLNQEQRHSNIFAREMPR